MALSVRDMTGRSVLVPDVPNRIVSLVPSQTELLYHLGLGDRIVGVTRFCIHPDHARQKATVIGGTKNIDPRRVLDLDPDLVIGNKEENDKPSILAVETKVPVWLSDIYTLDDALHMIRTIGSLCQCEQDSIELSQEIDRRFRRLPPPTGLSSRRVIYLIWANPWMAVAGNTFIDHMITRMGLVNALGQQVRYPIVLDDELTALAPEVVLLSSEPFPFQAKHEAQLQSLLPDTVIQHVDGEMFSWYGSRLLKAPGYLSDLSLRLTEHWSDQ